MNTERKSERKCVNLTTHYQKPMSQRNIEAITIIWKEWEHKHNIHKPRNIVKALLRINVDTDVRARKKKTDESPNTDTRVH